MIQTIISLTADSIDFLIAAWYLFHCFHQRTQGKAEEYPWCSLILFTIVIIGLLCCFVVPLVLNFDFSSQENLIGQIISSAAVLIGVIVGMFLIGKLMRKGSGSSASAGNEEENSVVNITVSLSTTVAENPDISDSSARTPADTGDPDASSSSTPPDTEGFDDSEPGDQADN